MYIQQGSINTKTKRIIMSYDTILVPVSGRFDGKRTAKSLEHAIALAPKKILLVHAYSPLPTLVGGEAHQELIKESFDKGLEILMPHVDFLKQRGFSYKPIVLEGHVADAITHVSLEEKCDLIVMYTDGQDNLEDFLLGSITERVLRNINTHLLAIRF